VQWSFRHLQAFLEALPGISGAKQIHLIAHSMGNRALTDALTNIAQKYKSPLFKQIVLAAPDVDSQVFDQIAEQVRKAGTGVTIYASNNDEALKASNKFHSYVRLGQGGDTIYTGKFTDTIDATKLPVASIGHSYFGDNPTVLTDIGILLYNGWPPSKRPPLVKQEPKPQSVFWEFVSQK
jgi:esterase/lipase superfamily enzyme